MDHFSGSRSPPELSGLVLQCLLRVRTSEASSARATKARGGFNVPEKLAPLDDVRVACDANLLSSGRRRYARRNHRGQCQSPEHLSPHRFSLSSLTISNSPRAKPASNLSPRPGSRPRHSRENAEPCRPRASHRRALAHGGWAASSSRRGRRSRRCRRGECLRCRSQPDPRGPCGSDHLLESNGKPRCLLRCALNENRGRGSPSRGHSRGCGRTSATYVAWYRFEKGPDCNRCT